MVKNIKLSRPGNDKQIVFNEHLIEDTCLKRHNLKNSCLKRYFLFHFILFTIYFTIFSKNIYLKQKQIIKLCTCFKFCIKL